MGPERSSRNARPDIKIELLVCGRSPMHGRELMRRFASRGFSRIAVAGDGAEALKIVGCSPPQLLVTAMQLSDMKYWAFIRTLRTNPAYPRQLPVLALSSGRLHPSDNATARELNVWLATDATDVDIKSVVEQAIAEAPKLKLLVIEDDPEFAELLQRRLIGYEIQIAGSGLAGISTYIKGEYDLVVLDLRLPDMSGESVLEMIHAQNPRQLVIIATGDADRDVHLLQRGVDMFLVKPLLVSDVQHACDRVWSQSSGQRTAQEADTLKDHLFLANECMLVGRASAAHQHIRDGLSTEPYQGEGR